MYKREDFSVVGSSTCRAFVTYNNGVGKMMWLSKTSRKLEGNEGDTNHLFFQTKQEAEQALTEFLNNQNKGEKEMKKSDLVNGMVVEMRDGDKYMVLKTRNFEAIVNEDDYSNLRDCNEDLTDSTDRDFDIVAIYEPQSADEAEMDEWDYLAPIWERSEHKELTVAEIEKQLGYKVKIVK